MNYYMIVRILNLVIGLVCVGLETFVYNWSINTDIADEIYLGVVSFFALEALIALLVYRNKAESTWETLWRIIGCCTLVGVSTWLIVSALDIENYRCSGKGYNEDGKRCHHYETKLVVAVLSAFNGMLYLFAKPRSNIDTSGRGMGKPQNYPGGTPGPNNNVAAYTDDSVPVYTMPRVHLYNQPTQKQGQTNMAYNYNANNTGPGSQFPQSQPPYPQQQQYPVPALSVQGSNYPASYNYSQQDRRY